MLSYSQDTDNSVELDKWIPLITHTPTTLALSTGTIKLSNKMHTYIREITIRRSVGGTEYVQILLGITSMGFPAKWVNTNPDRVPRV